MQGVLDGGREPTGSRPPSRQAKEEEGEGDTMSLGTLLGPQSAEAKMGLGEGTGPQDKCQNTECLLSVPCLSSCQGEKRIQRPMSPEGY